MTPFKMWVIFLMIINKLSYRCFPIVYFMGKIVPIKRPNEKGIPFALCQNKMTINSPFLKLGGLLGLVLVS